jgi:hypothetical protein
MASELGQVAEDVVVEALLEATGESKRRWALVLVAFVVAGVIAAAVAYRVRMRMTADNGRDAAVTPSQT